MTVTPTGSGITPSIVTALRFYTANDTEGRDPADFKLEGSNNGGASYTLIASNSLALPAARNNSPAGKDPLTQGLQQIRINTTNGYSTYRVTFIHVKTPAGVNSMQIGEVEILGVLDTNGIPRVSAPDTVKAFDQTSATLTATVSGNPAPGVRWQHKVGLSFVNLSDGEISLVRKRPASRSARSASATRRIFASSPPTRSARRPAAS